MHPAFGQTTHRPWALPTNRWRWRQSWCDLLFAHWPIAADRLRPFVPKSLDIEEFDGTSWVGVVPFWMSGVMRRPWPDMPFISAFGELNVRVYVTHGGKSGVWFFSLDATNPLAVWAARRFFSLPYFHAAIKMEKSSGEISYALQRKRSVPPACFQARYQPVSGAFRAQPGTIEHWLTERYCLYTTSAAGRLYCCEVHHVPWPLQQAEAEIQINTVCEATTGIELHGPPVLLHFATRLDVVVWPLELVA